MIPEFFLVPSTNYTISEQATPISSHDTSGSVGTISLTFPLTGSPDARVSRYGMKVLVNRPFLFESGDHGTLTGLVTGVDASEGAGSVTLTGTTVLGPLNVYNVQAQPFRGTLGDAFAYYCGLAGVTGAETEAGLADREVVFPGWGGELWYHLKMMAAAMNAEISFENNRPGLRSIRQGDLSLDWSTDRGETLTTDNLAQRVEVVSYSPQWVESQPVYPAGGWSPEVEILSVGPSETVEHTIEVSASLFHVQQPFAREFVGQYEVGRSVYTVVGDDGFPIKPRQWYESGGDVRVSINEDTSTLTVTMRGPSVPIYMSDGEKCETFSLALASDESGHRYSTLRLVGSGVAFDKETISIPTGIPPHRTGTDVGVTIDNPFLQDMDDVYRTGVRAAKHYSGLALSSSATTVPPAQEFQFGAVAGSRVRVDDRPYRVREATYSNGSVTLSADDDYTFGDNAQDFADLTYSQVQSLAGGLSYLDVVVGGGNVIW